ncbi:MAG: internalization competence protein, competence protein ComEC protein [Parcubacteria group bacterium GW2011_GWC1_38_6]|nr:MAG: internalization-related competence protein ComEC/Rec2 protein [Parcubacteria group bacterium GW2011_GWA1_36_12]KKQ77096.1 MAG: internalization competence protein, competence protein ComEC protein [Parcubacteria group bacterium GW2011_GWC1_38_6]
MHSARNSLEPALLGFLIIINIVSYGVAFNLNQQPLLEVDFFDVGQGDATLLKTPAGHKILIDGGPDSTVSSGIAKQLPFWDRNIDLIILTHPDRDHMAGLIDVLKRYDAKNILWNGVVRDTPEYRAWMSVLEKEGAHIFIAQAGQVINSAKKNNLNYVRIDILYPSEELEGLELEDSNETSVVAKLNFKDHTFLFAGDIGNTTEQKLISSKIDLDSDILKVAHHGSRFSTSESFVESVTPEIAIIQVGKNSYGHPSNDALERLKRFGIDIVRTDESGSVKIISDGKQYAVSYF